MRISDDRYSRDRLRFDVALQLDLRLDTRRAKIIQFVFEHLAVMLVVAHRARRHRRERQGAKDKIIDDLAELQVGGRRAGRSSKTPDRNA